MEYLSNYTDVEKTLKQAFANGIEFFWVTNEAGQTLVSMNLQNKTEAKIKQIATFLGKTVNDDKIYLVNGAITNKATKPAPYQRYFRLDKYTAAPVNAPTTSHTIDINNIQELATLRVENQHLQARIKALELKNLDLQNEVFELSNELDDLQIPEVDEVDKYTEKIAKHMPLITQMFDMFKGKVTTSINPMPNLADAPAPVAPAPTLIRYTPEYFNYLQSIFNTQPDVFYSEYERAETSGNEKHLPQFQNIIASNGGN